MKEISNLIFRNILFLQILFEIFKLSYKDPFFTIHQFPAFTLSFNNLHDWYQSPKPTWMVALYVFQE